MSSIYDEALLQEHVGVPHSRERCQILAPIYDQKRISEHFRIPYLCRRCLTLMRSSFTTELLLSEHPRVSHSRERCQRPYRDQKCSSEHYFCAPAERWRCQALFCGQRRLSGHFCAPHGLNSLPSRQQR